MKDNYQGKLKDGFSNEGNKGNKGNNNNRPIPLLLKNRFGPYGDKGLHKKNGAGRNLGNPNVFDKSGNKKDGHFKETDSKSPKY